MSAQMQRMRSQIEQLQAELLFYRGDATIPFDELQVHQFVINNTHICSLSSKFNYLMIFVLLDTQTQSIIA